MLIYTIIIIYIILSWWLQDNNKIKYIIYKIRFKNCQKSNTISIFYRIIIFISTKKKKEIEIVFIN